MNDTTKPGDGHVPSGKIAEDALDDKAPDPRRHYAGPEDLLEDMGVDDPFELTGLYEGIPMTEKSVMDVVDRPDTIWLFRRPILDEWSERGDVTLGQLVAHVTIHELAHHFGWSDEEIAEIDRWWE